MKHYKDRHNGMSPPAHLLEAMDKSCSDGEGDDSNGNPSYEDEEEYNLSEVKFNYCIGFLFIFFIGLCSVIIL